MKSRPASKQTRRPRQHAIDEQVLCNGFKRACASQTLEETDGLTEDAATWCSEQYQVLRTSCIGIINLRDTLYLVQLETQAGNLGYRHYHDFGEIIQKPQSPLVRMQHLHWRAPTAATELSDWGSVGKKIGVPQGVDSSIEISGGKQVGVVECCAAKTHGWTLAFLRWMFHSAATSRRLSLAFVPVISTSWYHDAVDLALRWRFTCGPWSTGGGGVRRVKTRAP